VILADTSIWTDHLRGGGAPLAPPSLTRGDSGAAGPEADLVEAFARSIDARVEWHWGALDTHLKPLERYELGLVAGGLSAFATSRRSWTSRDGAR
jgi:hypothetical protein